MRLLERLKMRFGPLLSQERAKLEEHDMLHRFLREQVLVTVCAKIPLTMLVTMLVATVLFYFIAPLVSFYVMLVWYLAVFALSMVRIFFALRGCRYGSERSLEARYRHFRIEAVAMAVLWALAAFFFYPQGHMPEELLFALIILAMAGGGAITLAIDRKIAAVYTILLLLALGLRMLACDEPVYTVLFFLTILYMLVFLVSIVQLAEILEKGIRQNQELGELRQRLDLIADQAPVGIFYFDTEYNVIDCNEALSQQIGVDKEMILKINLQQLKDQRPLATAGRVLEEGRVVQYEGPYVAMTTGREMWVSAIFSPLRNLSGEIVGGIGVLQDKTAEHEALERAEFLAYHDSLTGLPNRKLLEDRFRLQIAQASREGYYSSLLFLDLDRFKHINDTYGHNVGDELLVETARRLERCLRQSDTVCRLGGDEFIIFLPMISQDPEKALEYTWRISRKIHHSLSREFDLEGRRLFVTTSIGAVLINGQGEEIDEILRKADIAMYHAKRKGQGVTSFYEEEMDRRLSRIIRMEHDLRHAIDRDELFLEYQPIVDLQTERVYGAEALLRWRMPDGTFVSPAEFVPIAEESKLIHQIGHWIIDRVCATLAELERTGRMRFYYISVNISSKQFGHYGFFEEVMRTVERHGIDPRQLKFEITETTLIQESDRAQALIARFNAEGIGFMIDDFGTGYSSLSYLKQFDFETIKIDRSFIRDILIDTDDVALVRAILDIARQFDYSVVAEGVETAEQKELLRGLEPTMFCQGYYFGKPMSLEKLLEKVGAQ
ncbi:putative bifunctional diguanylate cyclase/phosphodiesterase [Hydrogenimonas sp.]